MPRIQPRTSAQVGPMMRLAYWYADKSFGHRPEPMTVWAHAPGVFWTWSLSETMVRYLWGRMPKHLGELAALRVASVVGCSWCLDIGSSIARRTGISDEKVLAVHNWATSAVFDAEERLVLEYADAMTTTPVDVDDALVARLRDAFGEEPTVELTATIALENQRARFNHALGLHAQGYSPDVCAARASALGLQERQVP